MTSQEFFSQDGDPEAWALIVDTSSVDGLLASISPDGILIKSILWDKKLRHSDVLLTNFLSLSSNLKKKNLKHIFFLQGPGSFTGLRVGAAFVKSLSFSLKEIPITTCSSFLPTAIQVIKENPDLKEFNILIPSIGEKYFSSNFKLSKGVWTESIDLDGALEGRTSLPNPFSTFDQINQNEKLVGIVKRSVQSIVQSFLPTTKISANIKTYTYLDLYPLYLRKSEAEEKNRYDKAKLQ